MPHPFPVQYTENKSFCEDLTEGKFSFPIIHGIHSDPGSTKLISILLKGRRGTGGDWDSRGHSEIDDSLDSVKVFSSNELKT